MSLKPLRDFIVVSVVKADEKTESGLLYKPGIVDEKIVTGRVLAVGTGYLTDNGSVAPLEVKQGDSVLFNKQMSVEVKHSGETVYLLREEHVLSVIS
jgi:chaperonin GroES